MPNSQRCAIAIMAKAPIPGRSKTRLCPPLDHDEAARLSGAFISDMTATLHRAALQAPIDAFVAYAPAGTEAALGALVAPGTRLLLADGGDIEQPGVQGFGRPLLQTIRILLAAGYGSACVLNSDSPNLPASLLIQAARTLSEPTDRAVMGAATDGGYYLLGLRAAHAPLFADIDWSTDQVAEQTRAQARAIGLKLAELPPWYDVDDAASLRTLLQTLDDPRVAVCAPATLAALAHLRVDVLNRCRELES